ncbi:MAG TPA: replicative DNA helicase [Methylibium sp.]|nr:replicative DNA helicase [Methylibium sp.]
MSAVLTPVDDPSFPPPDSVVRERAITQLRIPPHSIEAESSVLGGLLLSNAAWDRVGDLLTDADFYRYEHRLVYAAIGQLVNANKPADVMTVYDRLQAVGKAEEVGGLVYLNALAQYVPSASNIRRYAEIVRERSVLRRVIAACDEASTAAFNTQGRTVEAILDEASQSLLNLATEGTRRADDWKGLEELVPQFLDRVQAEADGTLKPDIIPTGLTALDERIDGGLRPGELVVIGARPSMGKSAMGLSIAVNVALRREPAGFISMEMPAQQVTNRAMSLVTHIHLSRLKRAERLRDFDWPALTEGVERVRNIPLAISDQSGLNINHIRAKARSLKRTKGLRVLVIDYLGLMDGLDPKQPRTYQLEDITKGLKRLAKELQCAVLLLVQLSRRVEERTDQMPILSDLRDSGAIEQDADIVVFIHRPHKANPTLGDEWRYYAKVSVAKVRDGDPGLVDLMYVGENTLFKDWPTDQEVPRSQVRTRKGGDL